MSFMINKRSNMGEKKINIIQGDITTIQCDAIVNAAMSSPLRSIASSVVWAML